ncbi:Alpha/Beta hydrolase protein [Hysterangium stoloniferum]|nr:Alpha/Beta hydrolase protein [Hysterangium stoloniferum]
MEPSFDHAAYIKKAHRFLIWFGGIYALLVALLAVPFVQTHLLYLHKARWPLFPDFAHPEKYGIAPQKAANIKITTSDNVTLGAWFILSDSFYSSSYKSPATPSTISSSPLSSPSISSALRLFPTVLYFHGNAGTRAVPFRIATYTSYTARLGANVLAIDYRGFGDSGGTPSEDGLNRDAHAAWKWVIDHGADPEDVVIVGQSLGTNVATRLVEDLEVESIRPRGLVLLAPFTTLAKLLETYSLAGWIPLLGPLRSLPYAQPKYDTKSAIGVCFPLAALFLCLIAYQNVKTDIVFAHAENDFDILMSHSVELFDSLLEPLLPSPALTDEQLAQPVSVTIEEWTKFRTTERQRQHVRENMVRVEQVGGLGTISEFKKGAKGPRVVFVQSKWGGHDVVGRLEGVIDVIGDVLAVKRIC